jgi:hypothetical protein
MNNSINRLSIVSLLAVAVPSFIFVASRQTVAQNPNAGSAPVRLVSQPPLPVTGKATVAGTVNAVQSGAWNVGVNARVSIRDVDNPALQPFRFDHAYSILANSSFLQDTNVFTVPAGKRLVVEYINWLFSSADPTDQVEFIALSDADGDLHVNLEFRPAHVGPVSGGGSVALQEGSQLVRLYVDAGETLQLFVSRRAAPVLNRANFIFFMQGYFIDL